jgi:YesN/AraC family two-component response regulator
MNRYDFRVVVVEDEILIRKYVILLLKKLGCTVVGETASGEEAIRLCKETNPELVLMDIRLKGKMDGIEAAQEIGRQLVVPILFLSAYDYQERVENEQIPYLLGYLKKPLEEYELESYLKKLKTNRAP